MKEIVPYLYNTHKDRWSATKCFFSGTGSPRKTKLLLLLFYSNFNKAEIH